MSKSARKHPPRQPAKKHTPPPKEKTISPEQREKIKRIVSIAAIVILAGIPFSIGKYFEFCSYDPFDSGAYVHSAAHILNGAEIGVDEKPSAQIGTLLVNLLGVAMFGYNETGPKLIQTIFQATALVLMFLAMRRLYGTLPAAVGVIVASMYLSWAFIAKTGNVKEQYMIACMAIGISCFAMYELSGKWWQAVVAGAVLSWAPLFKQTGVTAMGAIGLFVILQPILKHQTWKQTGRDILLLFGGAFAGILPLYIWMLGWGVKMALPYAFVWQTLAGFIPSGTEAGQAKAASDYVTRSREFVPFDIQYRKVMYHYGKVIMPIALASVAIVIGLIRWILSLRAKKQSSRTPYDRFFLLFAVWWILDMAFVWISPRSYVQYYLPLNASAAMLGAYGVAVYWDKAKSAANKTQWLVMGMIGLLIMIGLSWHVFFERAKGKSLQSYQYMIKTASELRKGETRFRGAGTGEYIRTHSEPTDRIYVWGWIPGIYVQAQRFSAASRACCLPRPAPAVLKEMVDELLAEFKEDMPKFIVDTRKRHIPVERPPYELWPIVRYQGMKQEMFLSPDESAVEAYEKNWAEMLRKSFGDKEAERFEILAPFRKFIRENYEIVGLRQYGVTRDGRLDHPAFGEEVLFERKEK
ncbi:MAG: glycosyltransferase family 39 protein [Sedimentisphaerales bacterium]|nr:glycosyltransferase family 39 protein [Sedimentisphaerales bacterium]